MNRKKRNKVSRDGVGRLGRKKNWIPTCNKSKESGTEKETAVQNWNREQGRGSNMLLSSGFVLLLKDEYFRRRFGAAFSQKGRGYKEKRKFSRRKKGATKTEGGL